MPMLIFTTDDYLYEKKRDIFILEIKNQNPDRIFYDREYHKNIEIDNTLTKWLDQHNIKYFFTGPPGTLVGWNGHYYVDFQGWEDPNLTLYCNHFENANGESLEPTKYQMLAISYKEWVTTGKLESYEKYLIDRENPDYEW
jgi:hypothetical protein